MGILLLGRAVGLRREGAGYTRFLQDEFSLLVFLTLFVRLCVLPPQNSLALHTTDVANHMQACNQNAFFSRPLGAIDNVFNQVGGSQGALEVFGDHMVRVAKMGLAGGTSQQRALRA